MEAKEFIEKWLVGYEDLEHKAELSIEMETDLIEYANQSKWISVEYEMPKKLNSHSSLLTEDVLVFDLTTNTKLIAWYSFKSAKWHCEEDIILNVTHWQPLPTDPCPTT